MKHELQDLGYIVVPGLISGSRARSLAAQLLAHQASGDVVCDAQAPRSPSHYNFLPFVRLLVEQVPRIGALCGEPVLPTYAYSRVYKAGELLARHVDRDACEISLTLHLQGDREWDIWLQSYAAEPVAVRQNAGDALLYLGCQTEHWREPYQGSDYLQVFLHYVLANGQRAYAFFDREKRP